MNLQPPIPTGIDLSVLVNWIPAILIGGGAVAISKLFTLFVKGSAGKILKGVSLFGLFAGILLLTSGVAVLVTRTNTIDVWSLLILTGLGLILKPLSKVPISALFGLTAGLLFSGLLYLYFPLPAAVLGVSSLWIYLAVFLVPALVVYLIFKFIEDLAKLFGLVLGSSPVLTVLGLLCVTQGLLLFFLNQSLLSFFP